MVGIGRLANLSLSGALITPPFNLRVLARIQIFLESRGAKPLASCVDAYVVRHSNEGTGLEWCEFSPPVVTQFIRSITFANFSQRQQRQLG
jgi:hypothetical protein